MQLKECLDSPCGLDYMLEQLELQSSYARRVLLETPFCTQAAELAGAYARLRAFAAVCADAAQLPVLDSLRVKLMGLKDIRHTISRLAASECLDDLELYEVKFLVLSASESAGLLQRLGLSGQLPFPDVEEVIRILDPDGLRMATFYVYDSYSARLAELRRKWRESGELQEELMLMVNEEEARVRKELCVQLKPFAAALEAAQQAMANADILLAKAALMLRYGFCIPEISDEGGCSYVGLFHPEVRDLLAASGKEFQPVDISFDSRPTLIVGANMGGKSVVLKSVALCQYLCQFGFGVPAAQARVALKDEIHFCIGDHQSVTEGLSSFAAEIRQMDALVREARLGVRLLALLDEPARTTNPVEGTALVRGLLHVLRPLHLCLLVATHYAIPSADGDRCLKVSGLGTDGRMDYSLEEVAAGEVPLEDLRIASRLGADGDWLEAAASFLPSGKKI
ncbi:MAG: DNA mismatch repair protein MutS [Bacteroidales bacterium]|nr:DNA mismatch repair protein MutS [Bacteroidales bacterium]